MKFNAGVAMIDPSYFLPMATAAEEAGFDGITLPDSIGYPLHSDTKYPYTPDGSREFLENKPFIEPLVAAAAMAAVTTRLRFQTGVLKLPVRHPVMFAKQLFSVAVLSGNRFALGIGTSPWPEDYDMVGLPWARRGRRFEECIEIIRGLASGDYYEHHGEFYEFPAFKMNPVPTEPIPMIIGGHAEAHIQRAARIGDGWMPAGMPTEQIAEIVPRLHELRSEHGRDHLPFEIHATNKDSATVDGIKRLEEAGVTHTSGGSGKFVPYGLAADTEPLQDKVDALRRYADEVIAKVR